MRDNFISRLLELAKEDKRIILITGDLGFKVFDEFRETLPDRFLNVGVAEQNMAGIAAGLALEGYVPFTYSIGNFPTLRCLEQIRNDICYHDLNVNVVSIGAGFSYGALGMSHHATEDICYMRSLPGITIVSPGDTWEVREGTTALVNKKGPGFLRLDKSSAREANLPGEKFELGKARVVRQGAAFSVFTSGALLEEALIAADSLAKDGILISVVNFHTLKPIDKESILRFARDTGGILTIEEHVKSGGFGSIVAEVLMDEGVIPGVFKRLSVKDEFAPVVGAQEFLRDYYGLNANMIEKEVRLLSSGQMPRLTSNQKA